MPVGFVILVGGLHWKTSQPVRLPGYFIGLWACGAVAGSTLFALALELRHALRDAMRSRDS